MVLGYKWGVASWSLLLRITVRLSGAGWIGFKDGQDLMGTSGLKTPPTTSNGGNENDRITNAESIEL